MPSLCASVASVVAIFGFPLCYLVAGACTERQRMWWLAFAWVLSLWREREGPKTFPPMFANLYRGFLSFAHVFDHKPGKLAGLYLGRSRHLAFEVVGDLLLQDGRLQ